jgi:hypothetical protein
MALQYGILRGRVDVFKREDDLSVDPLQSHPIGAALAEVAAGFTLLPRLARSASTALDYFRAPLFDWPTGVAVPSTGQVRTTICRMSSRRISAGFVTRIASCSPSAPSFRNQVNRRTRDRSIMSSTPFRVFMTFT